ncbi:hypothetical protein MADE_000001022175 [Alteromonas mediterranea DE]|uniref:Uncharacterized protein n=1 Tax=Alteromonas mediterranea (strain DSM 17117 / CIP 110805 / LMG 28347 / Deep ecotype) TaxID=1774373 RepID=T2DMK0_ALTMD|nr:hypothetical protein MADE_000001022175 [Alteromonas mediterranea DE]
MLVVQPNQSKTKLTQIIRQVNTKAQKRTVRNGTLY